MLMGIDVSSWQRNLDVGSTGADFVVIKATQGTEYVNPYMEDQLKRVSQTGQLLGLYHYASGADPIAEADFFVDTVGSYANDAMLALDWEENQNKSFEQHEKWCLAFLKRVRKRTKQWPVLYINANTLKNNDWGRTEQSGFDLWLAGYPDLRDSWELPPLIFDSSPWQKPNLWQYTNSGGSLDRNVFYGEREDWKKYL